MLPQEIIRRKRDGARLTAAEIAFMVAGISTGSLSEGQVGAFAMAIWFRGMDEAETVALTLAMRDSGQTLSFADFGRPVADKHSTGGVGDNISLMLAPIAAACGLVVPMISGRGLGHTGGTLDKLEAIRGYRIVPDEATLRATLSSAGCAIIGQSAALAPADKRLYAVRDVTATVDSIPLITASILSKKLAAGLQSLVLDVKFGSGATIADPAEAKGLARSLVRVANGAGLKTSALLTDMNEPLADAAGNALEIRNAIDFLKGDKQGTRLEQAVLAFAAEMLVQSGLETEIVAATARAQLALASGAAAECFARMVAGLGGPSDLVDRPDAHLPAAPVVLPVPAPQDGYLAAVDARAVGMAVIGLKGGRSHPADIIDHRTGFDRILPLGTKVGKGQAIMRVHAADALAAEAAVSAVSALYAITPEAVPARPLIADRIAY